MSRKYKCYGTCGEKHSNEEMIIHSNKRYCKICYENKINEEEDRRNLYNLIKRSYNVTFPTSMHLAQIKKAKDNGYTYYDMILGLNYCNEVLKLQLNPRLGFGYVTNNIEAAKMHYKEIEEKNKKNNNIFLTEETIVEKVVAKKIDNTNEFMKSKMINMEDLI